MEGDTKVNKYKAGKVIGSKTHTKQRPVIGQNKGRKLKY